MSTKHTPGPWVLFEVGGDNGTRPAQCPVAESTKQSILTVTEEAGTTFAAVLKKEDARLIAAAPELLEACKAQHRAIDLLMAKLVTLDPTFMPTKSAAWPACVAGNAAIAKANGGGTRGARAT